MNRIAFIKLHGFKGQERIIDLDERTVLSGPNGLGKSAFLEGLVFALTGRVPTGKSKDEAAKFFALDGGHVTIGDRDGNRLTRGVDIDHEKRRVSESYNEVGDAEWTANAALVDMAGFLALSADKRREFVLELVGAGDVDDPAAIEKMIGDAAAKELAGAAATIRNLNDPEFRAELPEEIEAVAEEWPAAWDHILSYLQTWDKTASELFQHLASDAKELKNAGRRNAVKAKAAIDQLEAGAKGARAASAEIDDAKDEVEQLDDELAKARTTAGEIGAIELEIAELKTDVGLDEEKRDGLDCQIAAFERLPAKPDAPEDVQLRDDYKRLDAEIQQEGIRVEAGKAKARADKQVELFAGLVEAHDKTPVGNLSRAFDALIFSENGTSPSAREQSRASYEQLKAAVSRVSDDWEQRRRELHEGARDAQDAVETFQKADLSLDDERLKELGVEADALIERQKAKNAEVMAAIGAINVEMERRLAIQRDRDEAERARKAAATRLFRRETALKAKQVADVTGLEESVRVAKERLETAGEAAGAVRAYETAIKTCEQEKIQESLWKAIETACKRAREVYVGSIVKPLVDDLGALLKASGRSESAYLRLENERGKPIFDLGWYEGESRRSLSALSAGESVLFTAALALTIARRAPGRRVLLIEADPLDEVNLKALFVALKKIAEPLDACIVATARRVSKAPAGWGLIKFGEAR